MRDGVVTAALVIIGFTVPMGIAWHQGIFAPDDSQPVVRAPVAAPVRVASNAQQVATTVAHEAEPPAPDDGVAANLIDDANSVDAADSADSAGSAAPAAAAEPVDAEAREIIRSNRRH